MKKIVIAIFIVTHANLPADPFKDLLLPKQSAINKKYYDLLPPINEERPDLFCIASREPNTMSLSQNFLEMLESATQAYHFVETGTYLGDSTAVAAKNFASVHSIELSDELFQKAQSRFAKTNNVHLYHGDSAKLLPSLIKNLNGKSIIFLDAHFSMGNTARGSENTPIITELDQIKKTGLKNAIIIIDDVRMFYEPIGDTQGTFAHGYPTLNVIVEKILEINPAYQCVALYDVLIAFPAQDTITISPLVRALTMSRLYDGTNYDIYDLLEAELTIAYAQAQEKEALIDLAQRWIEKWSEPFGLSRHYALWYGLILMVDEEYPKAEAYFREAKKRGLTDWRIDWYIAMAQANLFFGIRK